MAIWSLPIGLGAGSSLRLRSTPIQAHGRGQQHDPPSEVQPPTIEGGCHLFAAGRWKAEGLDRIVVHGCYTSAESVEGGRQGTRSLAGRCREWQGNLPLSSAISASAAVERLPQTLPLGLATTLPAALSHSVFVSIGTIVRWEAGLCCDALS